MVLFIILFLSNWLTGSFIFLNFSIDEDFARAWHLLALCQKREQGNFPADFFLEFEPPKI